MIVEKRGKHADFAHDEIDGFRRLVVSEGRVAARSLPHLMLRAEILATLSEHGRIIATAALKTPNERYRSDVFRKAGLNGQATRYPLELGWVVVNPDYRRQGLATRIVRLALADIAECVYATSQDRDNGMHHILRQHRFRKSGDPYPAAEKQDAQIFLFLRE